MNPTPKDPTIIDDATKRKTIGRPVVVLVLVMLCLIRGLVILINLSSLRDDPDAYRQIATTLSDSGAFGTRWGDGPAQPTAFRPPLYPWVLSWWVTSPGPGDRSELSAMRVAALHVCLSIITLIAVYRGGRVTLPRWAALSATSLVAVDPILNQQATQVMTETLAVTLTSLLLWAWMRGLHRSDHARQAVIGPWACVVVGAILALAYLCRPTFVVWAGMLVLSIPALGWPPVVRWRSMAVVTLLVASAVATWTWRNAAVIGHPLWATSHGGYTLLLANNRYVYDAARTTSPWQAWDAEPFLHAYDHRHGDPKDQSRSWGIDATAVPQISKGATEIEEDRWAAAVAKATIRDRPEDFAWSSVLRVMRLWSPFPLWVPGRSYTGIAIIGAYYTIVYGMIAVSLWRWRRDWLRPMWVPVGTLCLSLTIVHAVYWSNMRMRAPAIPGLCLVAAACGVRPRPVDGHPR